MAQPLTVDQAFHQFLESGDQSDLALVFDKSSPALLRQAAAAGLGADAAEDVVQETFIVVMERRDRFVRGEPFMPWASGILVRQIRAEKRRRARALEFLELKSDDSASSEEDHGIAAAEVRRVIEKGLRTVSESNREVVRLSLFEGLSAAEIGEHLSISPGATSVRLHRGLKELREKVRSRVGTLGVAALAVPTTGSELSAAARRASGKGAAKKTALTGSAAGWTYAALGGMLVAAAALLAWWPSRGSGASAAPGAARGAQVARTDAADPAGLPVEESTPARVAKGGHDQAPQEAAPLELSYRGRVQLAGGGPAGAGVKIYAIETDPGIVLPTSPLRPVALTDEHGNYSVSRTDLPPGPTACILLARLEGDRQPMRTGWTTAKRSAPAKEGPEPALLDAITLTPGFFMDIKVLDEQGQPVEGAQLSALSTHGRFFRHPSEAQMKSGFVPVRPYHHLFGAESDDQGRARIQGVFGSEGNGTIGLFSAHKDGYAAAMIAMQIGGTQSMEKTLVLRSLASLNCSGTVTSETGTPLGSVGITFRIRGEAAVSGEPVVRTAPDGSWSLPQALLDEFPMELVFSKAGYSPTLIAFQESGELASEAIKIQLAEAAPWGAAIADADGEPVQGLSVHVGVGSTTRSATTDLSGRVGFTDLQSGPIAVTVWGDDGEGRRPGASFVVENREAEQRLRLPPAPVTANFSCAGDPVDPLSRASLMAMEVAGFEGEWALLEGQGHSFASTGVPVGRWVLTAKTKSGRNVVQEVEVREGAPPEPLRISAPLGGSVQVILASSATSPPKSLGQSAEMRAERLPFVELPFWIRSGSRSPADAINRRVPADAPIVVSDLCPGTWSIVVRGEGWASPAAIVEIEPGGTARVDLVAEQAARVHVQLPRLGGPGWCTVQFRRDVNAPWIVHDVVGVSPDGFEHAETTLAPGKWQWRACLKTYLEGEVIVDQRPTETGTLVVPAKGKVTLAPWGDD